MTSDADEAKAPSPKRKPDYVESIGPTDISSVLVQNEVKRALIWVSVVCAVAASVLLAQQILLIVGALVLAAMLDGGTRLLGRVLPLPRGLRLTLVVFAVVGFLGWTVMLTGTSLVEQAIALQDTIEAQAIRLGDWAQSLGLTATVADFKNIGQQILGSVGKVTAAVSSVFGTLTNVVMMGVLGIFIAAEPRLYERGVAWMLPLHERSWFYGTMDKMAFTMRRLMAGRLVGMGVEGIGTWLLLWIGGVPMAALLGVLTGILAFLPNIGSIISGVLIVTVGFSAGWETGIFAFAVYMIVQIVDGYLIVPMVARRAVDMAPALVLGAQILFGAVFGILGLALADPIVAMAKVALERRSERLALRLGIDPESGQTAA